MSSGQLAVGSGQREGGAGIPACAGREKGGDERSDTSRSTRMEKWDRRVERLAVAMEAIALGAVVMVMAVLLWEWVQLYRSLPPGTMRMFGSM